MTGNTRIMLLEGLDLDKIIGSPTPSPGTGGSSGSIPQGASSYDSILQLVGLGLGR